MSNDKLSLDIENAVNAAISKGIDTGISLGILLEPTREGIEGAFRMVLDAEIDEHEGDFLDCVDQAAREVVLVEICASLSKGFNTHFEYKPSLNCIEVSDRKENSGDGVSYLVTRVAYLDNELNIKDIESIDDAW